MTDVTAVQLMGSHDPFSRRMFLMCHGMRMTRPHTSAPTSLARSDPHYIPRGEIKPLTQWCVGCSGSQTLLRRHRKRRPPTRSISGRCASNHSSTIYLPRAQSSITVCSIYKYTPGAQNQHVYYRIPGSKWVLCVPDSLCLYSDILTVRISIQLIPRVIGICSRTVFVGYAPLCRSAQLSNSRLPDQTAYLAI